MHYYMHLTGMKLELSEREKFSPVKRSFNLNFRFSVYSIPYPFEDWKPLNRYFNWQTVKTQMQQAVKTHYVDGTSSEDP